jgi:type II secretory pathway pseudopilin PulG
VAAYRTSGGFTYLALMVAMVLIGAALAAVGEIWSVQAQREREVELIWRGDAIRQAIRSYVLTGARFPMDLQDLVDDQRTPTARHHLRRIYEDPMSGAADWTLIRAADGGIMGVASSSQASPIKRKNFSDLDGTFEDADCYCDWQFVYQPRRLMVVPVTQPSPTAPATPSPGSPGNSPRPMPLSPTPGTGFPSFGH